MAQRAPVRDGALLRVTLPDGSDAVMTADEAWDLQESVRDVLCGPELPPAPEMRVFREVEVRGRRLRFAVSRHLGFWAMVAAGAWEERTFAVLERLVTADSTYLDLGAWIGPTVLFAAQRAERTFAFEPDPVAFRELSVNCDANRDRLGAVTLLNRAIAPRDGTCRLTGQGEGGNSNSSLLLSEGAISWQVEGMTLETFLRSLGSSGRLFVKMDIEGGEYDLGRSVRQLVSNPGCTLLLSLHPFRLALEMRARAARKGGPRRTWAVRALLRHVRLILSLPARHLYLPTGERLSRRRMLADPWIREVLVTREAPGEVSPGSARAPLA